MNPDYFLIIFAGILGTIIGSFLNVVILRLEKSEKLSGRSYCPHCKYALEWFDLVPIVSFLFLAGKCRKCRKNISWQYWLVELATGILFAGILYSFSSVIEIVFLWYIASSLMVIFVYDFYHYEIPDKVLFPAIIITTFYQIAFHFQFFITNLLWAGLGASLFFLVIFLVSKGEWMGFGDVKLAVLLGFLLGFPNILVGLTLSFFLGAVIGVASMVVQKKGLKSQLPFAPFLITGTLVALFFGEQIINWYFSFFVF